MKFDYFNYIIYMGVKNLIKFIERYAPNAISYKKIDEYKNTCIGFDANLLFYKIIYGIRVRGYDIRNEGMIVTHIHALLLKFLGFIKHGITPIFVFDSKMPQIKSNTMKKRNEVKKKLINKYKKSKTKEGKRIHYYVSTDLTQSEIEDCEKLIILFGYNVIYAKEEADSQLVKLYELGVIDYIASDDMDILLFGGKKMLKKFTVDSNKFIQEIHLDMILSEAKITMDELIRIGLLHGTDYCDEKNISSIRAYDLVKNNQDKIKIKCKKAFDYFIKAPSYDIYICDLKYDRKIEKILLKEFLLKAKFKNTYIKQLFDDIMNIY